MKLKAIIVDDEPIARQIIKEYLEDIHSIELVGEAENAYEAVELIKNNDLDLLFLDIEMPKINGLSLLDALSRRPLTIITTAHQQFALKGYELDVVDYILKPISRERLLKAVNKAMELFTLKSAGSPAAKDFFFVKTHNKLEKIALSEIFFIEAVDNYVFLHTRNQKKIAYLTTKGLESTLPKDLFIRIHKSYIVAIEKIVSMEGNQLHLENGQTVPISDHYHQQVMRFLRPKILKR